MIIGMIAFTARGRALGSRVQEVMPTTQWRVYDKTREDAKTWTSREFYACDAFIFIGATGIAVRLIAPFLQNKAQDPAVVVMDERGHFVISLVSGHLGGANALTAELSARLDAVPVITTATDINGVWAVDMWAAQNTCVVANPTAIKPISAALLNGEKVGVASDFPVQSALPQGLFLANSGALGISLSFDTDHAPFTVTLNLVPKIVVLGAGCRKNTSFGDFEMAVRQMLAQCRIWPQALRTLASIDLKREEPCFIEFAHHYRLAFETFSAKALNAAAGDFNSSDFVKSATGTDNVCERAAVLASGGRLIYGKTVRNGITLALAVPDWQCDFNMERS